MFDRLNQVRTYDLTISEGQRVLLVEALAATPRGSESQALLEMLEGIPAVERKEPGVSHGLCY